MVIVVVIVAVIMEKQAMDEEAVAKENDRVDREFGQEVWDRMKSDQMKESFFNT